MIRPPDAPPPQPHLVPTKPSTLLLAALLAAVVAWGVTARFYAALAVVPWGASVSILLLAIVEGMTARAVKQRIDRIPGTEPVDPLFVARLAALAKASSLTGAVLGGCYVGSLAWALFHRSFTVADEYVAVGAGGLVAAGMLVAGALWLEHSCRVPEGPDDTYDPDAPGTDDESLRG